MLVGQVLVATAKAPIKIRTIPTLSERLQLKCFDFVLKLKTGVNSQLFTVKTNISLPCVVKKHIQNGNLSNSKVIRRPESNTGN